MKKQAIQLIKGRDAYLTMTALSDYARQRGWKVIREVVTISMPEGKELEQLLKDLKSGKIRVETREE